MADAAPAKKVAPKKTAKKVAPKKTAKKATVKKTAAKKAPAKKAAKPAAPVNAEPKVVTVAPADQSVPNKASFHGKEYEVTPEGGHRLKR